MLSRVFHFMKDHLVVKLALAVTILLSAAYFLISPVQTLFYNLLDYYYYDCGNLGRIEGEYRIALQEYITSNKIASTDTDALYEWNVRNPDISLSFSDDTYVYYIVYPNEDSSSLTDYNNSHVIRERKSTLLVSSYPAFYPYECADGEQLLISLSYFGSSRFYLAAYYLSLVVCLLLFLIPLLLLIRCKTRYIQQLSGDLHILEGGDLLHPVKERGSDELYYLSHGINQMRLAIVEKQEQAAANDKANRQLVTSLSHDLRTPLTSIIGYLEIMKQHKYRDEKQLEEFIAKTQEKAFVMKEISDRLFEYFLVSQKVAEEYHMEDFAIPDLLSSLLDNQIFDLSNHGYTVEAAFDAADFHGVCRMDVEFMQRVLDNILSNIRKYADPTLPVKITASESGKVFSLRFENGVNEALVCSESTGIGLKTCRRIMAEHHGELVTSRSPQHFAIEIRLPLIR